MTRSMAGFTLVELLVTIVIIAIGLTLAVPGFQGMFARNRVVTQVNEVIIATSLARSEALRRGSVVSVLAVDGSDATNEFGPGYCVYVGNADPDSDSCADGGGVVLRQFEALEGEVTLNSVENDRVIRFNGTGGVRDETNKNLDLCYQGQEGRRIHISLIGRPRAHRPDDADTNKRPGC